MRTTTEGALMGAAPRRKTYRLSTQSAEHLAHCLRQIGRFLARGSAHAFTIEKMVEVLEDLRLLYTPTPENVKVYRLGHARVKDDDELTGILFEADSERIARQPGFYLALVEEIAERLSRKA